MARSKASAWKALANAKKANAKKKKNVNANAKKKAGAKKTLPRQYRSYELFAGAGGMTEGLRAAGIATTFAVDLSADACATLKANHPQCDVLRADVADVTADRIRAAFPGGRIDDADGTILIAAPPCQSFSVAGNKRGREDPGDRLYEHVPRLAGELRPAAVVFENVPGMVSKKLPDGSTVLESLTEDLELAGYAVDHTVIDAKNHGVPQSRKRVILVAVRRDLLPGRDPSSTEPEPEFAFPWPAPVAAGFDASVGSVLHATEQEVEDAMEANHGYDVYMDRDKAEYYKKRKLNPATSSHVGILDPDDPAKTLRAGYMKSRGSHMLITRGRDGRTIRKLSSGTKIGSMRMLTVPECKAIQTFPRDYRIVGGIGSVYTQLGNAVPCKLAEHVGRALLAFLRGLGETAPVAAPPTAAPAAGRAATTRVARAAGRAATTRVAPAAAQQKAPAAAQQAAPRVAPAATRAATTRVAPVAARAAPRVAPAAFEQPEPEQPEPEQSEQRVHIDLSGENDGENQNKNKNKNKRSRPVDLDIQSNGRTVRIRITWKE